MHEFSIALSIIEIAEKEATKQDAQIVSEMVLDIGTMAGIEFHALDFAMQSAVKGTMLENSIITVNKIPAKARCNHCKLEFDIESSFDPCPECGSFYHEILTGKELKVRSLVLETKD